MLGSVGMTDEEEEVVGGRSTSSYTATFLISIGAPEKIYLHHILSESHITLLITGSTSRFGVSVTESC